MKPIISRSCLAAVVALVLILGSADPSFCGHKVKLSDALSAIMNQLEVTYLARRGMTFVRVLDTDPPAGARLLGIGMMSQVEHSKKSEANRSKYLELVEDIKGLLREVARIHQSDPNGLGLIDYDQLWNEFKKGFTGKANEWAMAGYGVDPFSISQPSVLHLAVGPGIEVPQERGGIPMGVLNAGAVILLQMMADQVQSVPPPSPPKPPPPVKSKYRWKALGIYTNPTWWDGSYKAYSPFGNPEKPVVSNITECCDSTKGCPGRNSVKVVPCRAVKGNCVMKVQLLQDSRLGKKGQTKCILLY